MRNFIFTAFLSILSSVTAWSGSLAVSDLRTGDILLQSMPCYMCSLIEIEEGKPFSHVGIFVQNGNAPLILEAWGSVKSAPVSEFLKFRKRGTETTVMRSQLSSSQLQEVFPIFVSNFLGHSYDSDFLWNNGDINGEKFYCSEMVAKLFNQISPNFF